jgi:CubicO group peptidase (beta-lactamase class C family)
LSHRSGIGDYLDESQSQITDYVMTVPVHALASTADFLPALTGHPMAFAPGTAFEYCNGGYVVLALLAERAAGVPFHELVRRHVTEPAGMSATAYDRSDELAGDAARHYLADEGLRTNVLHLPVRGSGDGGAYTTVDDIQRFWTAIRADRLVSAATRAELWTPHSDVPRMAAHYGMGFWLRPDKHVVWMEGYDAGVSFRSVLRTDKDLVVTVMANHTDGAWSVVPSLEAAFGL